MTKNIIGDDIEDGVFLVVKCLNKLDVNTVASCEGHLDHGETGPWVDIESNVDASKLEESMSELKSRIASGKLNYTEGDKLHCQYEQLFAQIRAINLKEQAKLLELLAGFYEKRQVDFDIRLHSAEIFNDGSCRLENQGVNVQAIRSYQERMKKLKEYQAEMLAFGKYLKSLDSN